MLSVSTSLPVRGFHSVTDSSVAPDPLQLINQFPLSSSSMWPLASPTKENVPLSEWWRWNAASPLTESIAYSITRLNRLLGLTDSRVTGSTRQFNAVVEKDEVAIVDDPR